MKEYDLLVVGGGSANQVSYWAHKEGLKVGLIEHGPLGGTCLNRGCVPSKMMIYPADVMHEARFSSDLNLDFKLGSADFSGLMDRVRARRRRAVEHKEKTIEEAESYDWYNNTGVFVDDKVIEVNNQELTADLIVIATGTRPLIPPIDGIDDVEYLSTRTIFDLTEQPRQMTIIGGGYVAAEFSHFFSAMGTDVTIVGRNPFLVKHEDEDVSEMLREELSKRMTVLTNHEAIKVQQNENSKTVIARNRESGQEVEIDYDTLLVATGRRPNSDKCRPERTGVELDENGFIKTDECLRTSKEGIWALGDATGPPMFKHVADREAEIVWHNIQASISDKEPLRSMHYDAIPHAVFSYPQIASVGKTLAEATDSKSDLLVGKAEYTDVAKGDAMGKPRGFCRIIVDGDSSAILGGSIIGPFAPILIQPITQA
ncbi:MAG: SidA/IucD/PvdA family monooxygenase, partial [Candidatus Lokiarchaeota archaeon]|nr:SidA/IucD/PvdA family monooxygenase [Candidatus Lokiarchaeota archaeon]